MTGVLGFRIQGLGFRVLGALHELWRRFGLQGSGVQGLRVSG